MKSNWFIIPFLLIISLVVNAQSYSRFIIVDQFGYPPDGQKIAVLKDPQTGFDQDESYTPGSTFSLVNVKTKEVVLSAASLAWKNGATDASSGDKIWYFDFSSVKAIGKYYVLDVDKQLRSYEFEISPAIYNEELKHAVRTFYYQRVGFAKEVKYAGEGWADGASHMKNLQDKNCRMFLDKTNAALERDVSGGWYDAGDFNKYTSWTSSYVVEMMLAYLERPEAWADNYNLPESGNGIPDLVDEAKWGSDHLLRLQFDDGSVISIVGESHASPPSSANGPSFYGPVNTSATLNAAGAMAIASKVFRLIGMETYADTLLSAAIKGYQWAEANPNVLFNNNDAAYQSGGLGAGQMETDDYGRLMAKLRAAAFLFEATGESAYRDFFDANYNTVHLMAWNFAYPFEGSNQTTLLYYANLPDATPSVSKTIKDTFRNAMLSGSENFPAYTGRKDPYLAHIKDYTWGSNSNKCSQGLMFWNLLDYNVSPEKATEVGNAGAGYIHGINGVNPLNLVYLSNMYLYGAENGVNEFYHTWFANGSEKWDRVGESIYGPPPGFLTGGPNPSYDWDGCCPSGCGSTGNNALCNSESIAPPKGQPSQKSYKDFNTSWPLNSWSVTENSCGYQINFIRLLSKYVDLTYDCNGDKNGSAFIDACGHCAGGNTGLEPSTNPENCPSENVGNAILKGTLNILVYPNPANDWLNIKTDKEDGTLKVFDGNGKLFIESCLGLENHIDIAYLTPGIYIAKIYTDEGDYGQTFIKN
ncbi:MAG: glycoside hydrolase family 9 protein [Prolixibacteraceae bacterium]